MPRRVPISEGGAGGGLQFPRSELLARPAEAPLFRRLPSGQGKQGRTTGPAAAAWCFLPSGDADAPLTSSHCLPQIYVKKPTSSKQFDADLPWYPHEHDLAIARDVAELWRALDDGHPSCSIVKARFNLQAPYKSDDKLIAKLESIPDFQALCAFIEQLLLPTRFKPVQTRGRKVGGRRRPRGCARGRWAGLTRPRALPAFAASGRRGAPTQEQEVPHRGGRVRAGAHTSQRGEDADQRAR